LHQIQLHISVERHQEELPAQDTCCQVAVQVAVRLIKQLRQECQPDQLLPIGTLKSQHGQYDTCLALPHIQLTAANNRIVVSGVEARHHRMVDLSQHEHGDGARGQRL
jgi:hypothetical protein